VGRVLPLSQEMKLEQPEYVTFNTNIVDEDVSLIAEYLLVVREPN
jgi:hypothetical protein